MAKLVGYILMILGILVIASKLVWKDVSVLASINILWIGVVGIILIVAGFLFLKEGSKARQEAEEVPIYHGKKIVGYRRERK